jgi:glycosyltransferase involved in cell wall biosynthesis
MDEYSGHAPVTLSAVVPAYNEAGNLEPFLIELDAVLRRCAVRHEIIVVNDGSTDETAALMARLTPALHLTYVELSRNFGKEAALTAGLDCARGEVVVVIDADFQDPPELIPQMLERWREGYDMVFGVRANRDHDSWFKRAGTAVLYRLLALDAPVEIPPDARDFRLMDRRVVDALRMLPERTRFMKGLYAWVGFRTAKVVFSLAPRRGGKTKFSFGRLVTLAMSAVTGFTNVPLRIWSAVGSLVSVAALAYGAWIVVETFLVGRDVPGWTTIVASIMFFSGVQLISIGVLGEYLSRVFDEVKGRPIYLVRRRIDCSRLVEREKTGHATRTDGR